MNIALVIPLYNGGIRFKECIESIKSNITYVAIEPKILLIDSSSTDGTQEYIKSLPFEVKTISSREFNHGATRNLGVELSEGADIVVFLTQDAILNDCDSIKNIVHIFNDPLVAVAYGKQLPHLDANPIAQHARLFNYKDKSYIADINCRDDMGIKTVFNSNSFSAYRVSTFNQIGGFPNNTILSEDMYFAAKAVLTGYKIAYVADAVVRHSHNYSPLEEFKRYFDIGVFHHDESWIRKEFGSAGGEGRKYLLSEFRFLVKNAPLWIPRACIMNFFKIFGYKLGQNYRKLPNSWVKNLSMHKRFWK